MDKRRIVTSIVIISIVVFAITFPKALAQAKPGDEAHDHSGKMDMKSPVKKQPLTLEQIHSKHLPMASKSIDKAIKAIQAKDSKTALAELDKVQKMLAVMNEAIGKHVKPKFANVRCPIMNAPIKPDKVTKNLIREYKGQKIAFCCAGCPSAWDKLTDKEKDTKLTKVKPAHQGVWTCSMHPQIKLPKRGLCPICNMQLIELLQNHSKDNH
jgi:hypothetical protein